jgi:hypothetical protein
MATDVSQGAQPAIAAFMITPRKGWLPRLRDNSVLAGAETSISPRID